MLKSAVLAMLLMLISSEQLHSQAFQWRLLPTSPGLSGGGRSEDIYFVDQNTGWVVGYSGLVHRTTNGGLNFEEVSTFTSGNELRSVGFFDVNT